MITQWLCYLDSRRERKNANGLYADALRKPRFIGTDGRQTLPYRITEGLPLIRHKPPLPSMIN
jgi:hypothetical protein